MSEKTIQLRRRTKIARIGEGHTPRAEFGIAVVHRWENDSSEAPKRLH